MSNESPFRRATRVIDAIVSAARQGNIYPTSGGELRGASARATDRAGARSSRRRLDELIDS